MDNCIIDIENLINEYFNHVKNKIHPYNYAFVDEHETVYSENYATADITLLTAFQLTKNLSVENKNLFEKLMQRNISVIKDHSENQFCRLFILHFSLLSLLILPYECKQEFINKYIDVLNNYYDDCLNINTNAVAMKISVKIYLACLNKEPLKEDIMIMNMIDLCKNTKNGFINDSKTEKEETDGMPISYHGFILFLLGASVFVGKKYNIIPETIIIRIEDILIGGGVWWNNILTADGSAAYSGRSGYQIFNYGINIFLQSIYNFPHDSIQRSLNYFRRFKKDNGRYSCSTNYFDNSLRIGFENYSHENMYNSLAFVGLCLSAIVLNEGRNIQNKFLQEKYFTDIYSGYAFFRTNNNENELFFACSLRDHSNSSTNAMSGFHFRYGNVPIPLTDSKIKSNESFLEGIFFANEKNIFKQIKTSKNVEITELDNGYEFNAKEDGYSIDKKILLDDTGITWEYIFRYDQPIHQIKHIIPMLINDGKKEIAFFKSSRKTINIRSHNYGFQLTCAQAQDIIIPLERKFDSPSGVYSNAEIILNPGSDENKEFKWKTKLNFLGEFKNSNEIYKIEDPNIIINNSEAEIIDGHLLFKIDATGKDLKYNWTVYSNETEIYKSETQSEGILRISCKDTEKSNYYRADVTITSSSGYHQTISLFIDFIKKDLIPCKKEKCTACMACVNCCPLSCIHREYDENGFKYPQIDKSICNGCNLCRKICPSNNKTNVNTQMPQNCYAAWNIDDKARKNSTSGGVFSAMANYVLKESGVVYGAYYDISDNFKVKIGNTDYIPFEKFRISKYVESDIDNSYKQAEEHLKKGRRVLFSGAPCQIAGLKSYLGTEYEKLYTIDFICGGFAGEKFYQQYIDALENLEGSQISEYSFRSKICGWNDNRIRILFKNERVYYLKSMQDPYYKLFQQGITVRENCFTCPYIAGNYKADITIGDYNGWHKMEEFNYDVYNGISQFIINTDKGNLLYKNIKKKIFCESRPINDVIKGNLRYWKLRDKSNSRADFLNKSPIKISEYFNKNVKLSNIIKLTVEAYFDLDQCALVVNANGVHSYNNDTVINYAWYIYKDEQILSKIMYNNDNTLKYPINDSGDYYVRVFAKDEYGKKEIVKTEIIKVSM